VIRAPHWLIPGSPFVGSVRQRFDDGDEVVVYNPVTCHTHLLNRSAADLLAALDDDPGLAAEWSLDGGHPETLLVEERERLASLVQELRFLGLIID